MKPLGKIAGFNLLALLAYSILIHVEALADKSEAGMAVLVMSAFAVGLHVVVCFIVAVGLFIAERKPLGNAWLMTAGIVLVIGFSTCLGNAAIS